MAVASRSHGDRSLPTVVSLTKYIPYPGVTHAGGEYLLAHHRALASLGDVAQFAPDSPINADALPRALGGPSASLLSDARPRLRGLRLRAFQLESVWAGSAIYWPVRRLFRTGRAPWRALSQARVIEFQWSEMIALAPSVRDRLPGVRLIGVAHDIITQRLERQAEGAGNPLTRALLRVVARRSRRRESRDFRALDVLLVFSEKDAELARAMAPGTRVEVVHPGLGPTDPLPRTPDRDAPIVLFTGAMNRPENWRSVLWFLNEIWTTVSARVPAARFVIAGANPPELLQRKVASTPRAELTGFVDSLEPWYARASVFAVPLIAGAGVKFKTIDAMLRGVPIVTTAVGAEGIGSHGSGAEATDPAEHFAAVTDDSRLFAEALVRELTAPDLQRVDRAQRWAENVYGVAAFERRIHEIYGGFIAQ